jgi:hypothetical protein
MEQKLSDKNVSEMLRTILMSVKLIIELDEIKCVYLDNSSSKLHQYISLVSEIDPRNTTGELDPNDKLDTHHQKLSDMYCRLFKEPIRILGKKYPSMV